VINDHDDLVGLVCLIEGRTNGGYSREPALLSVRADYYRERGSGTREAQDAGIGRIARRVLRGCDVRLAHANLLTPARGKHELSNSRAVSLRRRDDGRPRGRRFWSQGCHSYASLTRVLHRCDPRRRCRTALEPRPRQATIGRARIGVPSRLAKVELAIEEYLARAGGAGRPSGRARPITWRRPATPCRPPLSRGSCRFKRTRRGFASATGSGLSQNPRGMTRRWAVQILRRPRA
jgi:hypothetical protein